MPSTQLNITKIRNAVKNYTRQQILDELNELQMIVFSENTMQVKRIDPATGMPPFIATTAGQREYDCPADCRETLAVFWEQPQNQYSPSKNRAMYTQYFFRNVAYYKIAVTSRNALIDTLATITFVDDPGTTTDKFFHEYSIKSPDLTSEEIQMAFPEEVHYLVRKAVIALLSSENYGATGFDDAIIQQISKACRRKMNKGAQARSQRTPWREEYRDAEFPSSFY